MHQLVINFRLVIFQRKVIEFCLDLGNTKTLGNRSINIHRLSGLLFLLGRCHKLHRTHVVQTVCQFHDDNTDILRHRKEHLSQVLCLGLQFILGIIQLAQFGNAIHQKCHLFTELCGDFIQCHRRIFYYVMKHSCHDRFFIHLQICKNDRHPERMDDIRLSGFTELILMRFFAYLIGLLDHRNIRRRVILTHTSY